MEMGLLKKPVALLSTIFVVVFLITAWSCRKKDQTCTAIVTAVDLATGGPVAGANVHLYPNVTPPAGSSVSSTVDVNGTTDGSGKATFTFKLQSILNCTVTAPSGATGTGIVKLEPAQTVEKTITVQ